MIFISSIILILIGSLIFGLFAQSSLKQQHEEEIRKIISQRGGEVQEIFKVDQSESPFTESTSGNIIYKIL